MAGREVLALFRMSMNVLLSCFLHLENFQFNTWVNFLTLDQYPESSSLGCHDDEFWSFSSSAIQFKV